jgi:hypothetical protein
MREYHFNEGAFEIPSEGVIDRSTTALEIPSGDKRLSIVVTRKPRDPAETLDAIASSLRESMTVSLRRFRPEAARATSIGGFPAIAYGFAWMHDTGPMYQRVAVIELDDLVLTLTVAGNEERRTEVNEVFEAVTGSMKYRRRG